jgi:hypothetical protein
MLSSLTPLELFGFGGYFSHGVVATIMVWAKDNLYAIMSW